VALALILVSIIAILLVIPASLGVLVLFHVFIRAKTPPVDQGNRINHFRLVWFALRQEDKFVGLFPWLKHDEWWNVDNNLE
jgi:hypothetical protein